MSEPADYLLEQLRSDVARELGDAAASVRDDIERLTQNPTRKIARTLHGRAIADPVLGIIAELGSRRVDNEGSFADSASVQLLSLAIVADPAFSNTEDAGSPPGIAYTEATAWRNVLFPSALRCYLLEDPAGPAALCAPSWHFVSFIGGAGGMEAPSDFDWVSHRLRYRGLKVSALDHDGNRVEETYLNEKIAPFYQPYTEARGRYWDIPIHTPPAAVGISRCFETLAIAVRRRGAMSDDIRPISMTWTHDNVVELVIRDDKADQCYSLMLKVPTNTDVDGGSHMLQAGPGGLGAMLASPEQYGASEVARIREMGTSGLSLWANPTPCC
ncbi:hypothetical protein [Nocardia fluminea]|uniref:hypothetical protein n=1 Tax=Nocardia fluminea TaxID=134984 RepID=UPI003D137442